MGKSRRIICMVLVGVRWSTAVPQATTWGHMRTANAHSAPMGACETRKFVVQRSTRLNSTSKSRHLDKRDAPVVGNPVLMWSSDNGPYH